MRTPPELIDVPTFSDARGALSVIDGLLPFEIRRVYWIYGSDGNIRGGHGHKRTRQGFVAVHGKVDVHVKWNGEEAEVSLDDPSKCLIVEPWHWHQMTFSDDAVLLVIASHSYDPDDYVYAPEET